MRGRGAYTMMCRLTKLTLFLRTPPDAATWLFAFDGRVRNDLNHELHTGGRTVVRKNSKHDHVSVRERDECELSCRASAPDLRRARAPLTYHSHICARP